MSIHEYFERNESTWNIKEFLEFCKIEPFDKKIDCYTKSLKRIANKEEGHRREVAQQLLIEYSTVSNGVLKASSCGVGMQIDLLLKLLANAMDEKYE
jgi:hypothetical protein